MSTYEFGPHGFDSDAVEASADVEMLLLGWRAKLLPLPSLSNPLLCVSGNVVSALRPQQAFHRGGAAWARW